MGLYHVEQEEEEARYEDEVDCDTEGSYRFFRRGHSSRGTEEIGAAARASTPRVVWAMPPQPFIGSHKVPEGERSARSGPFLFLWRGRRDDHNGAGSTPDEPRGGASGKEIVERGVTV